MTLPPKKRSLPSFCRFGQKEGATRHERLKRKRIDNRKVAKNGRSRAPPLQKRSTLISRALLINILMRSFGKSLFFIWPIWGLWHKLQYMRVNFGQIAEKNIKFLNFVAKALKGYLYYG